MPLAAAFSGIACGLLIAIGAACLLRSRADGGDGAQEVALLGWLSAFGLVIAALLSWLGSGSVASPAPRLYMIAAISAPIKTGRAERTGARAVPPLVTALVLAISALFWTWIPVRRAGLFILLRDDVSSAVALVGVLLCAGLGARAMGSALADLTSHPHATDETPSIVFGLLTLVATATILPSLIQRGTMSMDGREGSGFGATLLAWAGVWLAPRGYPRLRLLLVTGAALLLLAFALMLA
jgi:hypothetical protein